MNPFDLFETRSVENIKLGLQVIKSLNLQKEFKTKMKISFEEYEDVFNTIVLVLSKTDGYAIRHVMGKLFSFNLDLSKLDSSMCGFIIKKIPETYKYFNLYSLNSYEIILILERQPQLIDKFNLSLLEEDDIRGLLQIQPQLEKYFNK